MRDVHFAAAVTAVRSQHSCPALVVGAYGEVE